MKYRNYFILITTVIISSIIFSGCGRQTSQTTSQSSEQASQENMANNSNNTEVEVSIIPQITQPDSVSTASANASSSATKSVVILTTKDGDIVIKLYDKVTPNTVKNFVSKIQNKFYDGLIFHRVIAGFMAQGGDPTGTGTGGGSIPSELNDLPFKAGSIGLARTPVTKDISNDSQFFICYDDFGCQHLTGDYVNFGEVVSGLDVLNKIVQGDKIVSMSVNQ